VAVSGRVVIVAVVIGEIPVIVLVTSLVGMFVAMPVTV
tara:strand:+ start:195 stop:308 length:114 start_codon:yes stop_codon:yes gene_type:complete